MNSRSNHFDSATCFKLMCLTLIAVFGFDHSQLDVLINRLFFVDGHWLLSKGAQPLTFIFYDVPKYLLIGFGVTLLLTFLSNLKLNHSTNHGTAKHKDNAHPPTKNAIIGLPSIGLSNREIGYLIVSLMMIPASIFLLKTATHVSCPSDLALFGGTQPYLGIGHSLASGLSGSSSLIDSTNSCFPAAHASTGFALYAFAFLPRLYRHRYLIFKTVTAIGWTLGLYKMLIGDHFFSHTLVSMLLSLTISYSLAYVFFTLSARQSTLRPIDLH
ncbi:phosphatase PAP2 family protein [Psychrobacter sp. FDAARGOS_221]|uniref:phosphatase PAP2 family protein n=1 Tax=Psychrobacter sp. FDAARGOS_221 TaxID=1975705 RepID=UPI000BB55F98|nr:phosphatase PAP2 family protein [Psychrobacter sp. FDAARGOS_221]PNK59495.1 PAP2 family protein [Psychrobacter sp. FDAARGOS_221]